MPLERATTMPKIQLSVRVYLAFRRIKDLSVKFMAFPVLNAFGTRECSI